jgi:hypothetical protein
MFALEPAMDGWRGCGLDRSAAPAQQPAVDKTGLPYSSRGWCPCAKGRRFGCRAIQRHGHAGRGRWLMERAWPPRPISRCSCPQRACCRRRGWTHRVSIAAGHRHGRLTRPSQSQPTRWLCLWSSAVGDRACTLPQASGLGLDGHPPGVGDRRWRAEAATGCATSLGRGARGVRGGRRL